MGTPTNHPVATMLARMIACGYTEQFEAADAGLLAPSDERVHRPEDMVVEQIARVEQGSQPDEQCVIFALRDPTDGTLGTYCVPFGPAMSIADARIVNRLDLS